MSRNVCVEVILSWIVCFVTGNTNCIDICSCCVIHSNTCHILIKRFNLTINKFKQVEPIGWDYLVICTIIYYLLTQN